MHESVRRAWVPVNAGWEGVVPWIYLDVLGLCTVAIGILIDPVETALAMPFVRPDGTPATGQEIRGAWQAVKSRKELAEQGHRVAARYTTLRLTPHGIEEVVLRKLDANHAALRRRFPAIDTWPADSVFACHSMAWACGTQFRFPRLAAALEALDFATAAKECTIREEGNSGVIPRNKANRIMFRNAARVSAFRLDPTELHYPAELVDIDLRDSEPATPIPPTERIPDTSAIRQTGTTEAMREHFAMPPVIIVDDTKDGDE